MRNITLLLIGFIIAGCAGQVAKPIAPPPEPDEVLIWSTHPQRPSWTYSEPEAVGDLFQFMGESYKYATEKDARADATRDSINKIAQYIGTVAQDKFQRIQTEYGLSTQVIDPTMAARRLQEQISAAFTTQVKPKEFYVEKWQNKKLGETYFHAFVLSTIPKEAIDRAFKEALDGEIDDLKKKRDAEAEEKAKNQMDNALKAFQSLQDQGFVK